MPYRFTRVWAAIQVAVGLVIIMAGILAGVAAFLWLPRQYFDLTPAAEFAFRLSSGAVIAVVGVVIGAPLVVTGQLVQVQLAMLRRLTRISRYLGRWERERFDREVEERRTRRLR